MHTSRFDMTSNYCPRCGAELPLAALNIKEGVALCEACGTLSRLAEVAARKRPAVEILKNPPAGCSVTDWGNETRISASLRSTGGFFGSLFIALFWNGIVSVFVLIAVAGLYVNLVGPLPDWFPAPENNEKIPLGMVLFLCLFLTPFVAIGTFLASAVFLTLAGKIEVRFDESSGSVRTGIGFLTWRKGFDPSRVTSVETDFFAGSNAKNQPQTAIVIEAERKVKFGTLLPEERREWLVTLLREALTHPDLQRRRDAISAAANARPATR